MNQPLSRPQARAAPPGTLSYPGGLLPFGIGKPTLLVNDQIGYAYYRPEVAEELRRGCFDSLLDLVQAGQAVGIQVVNVQLMEPSLDECDLVPRVVAALYETTGCAIAVDSRRPEIVERALAAYPYKALCNTVTGEPEVLEAMLPIIAKYGAAVGTALVHPMGVPETVEDRLAVARRIVEAAEAHGIPREDVMIDGVCLPSAVMPDTMRTTLRTLQALHEELGVPTLLGISNAGYGLPNPTVVDLAFLLAAVSWGLDVAMVNPATPCLADAAPAIDFLMGTDRYAQRFLRRYRAGSGGAEARLERQTRI